MKKLLKIIGVVLVLVIIAAVVFIARYKPKKYTDFGVFTSLRGQIIQHLDDCHATQRPITREFSDFTLSLAFPFSKVFGNSVVGIPLQSYESDKIAVATISQFEVPPKSGYYRDVTLNIRPRYELKAPVLHMDFMKPSPGVPGLCSIDFFTVDKENISLETFFGKELGKIQEALSLVETYQRTVEEGRGKITRYLDSYKSPYRIELKEPATDDENVRRQYYQTVEKAMGLVLPAYFAALGNAEPDPGFAERHREKMQGMVQALWDNDVAVSLGRKIFKEHFKKYWLDGFWNVQIALQD